MRAQLLLLVLFTAVVVEAQNVTTPAPASSSDDKDRKSVVNGLKVASIFAILIASLAVAMVVIFIPTCHSNKLVMSLASSFSAGVFLVIGLAHMLPEADEFIAMSYDDEHEAERWRAAFIVTISGFLAMLIIERGLFGNVASVEDLAEDEEETEGTTPVNEPHELEENPQANNNDDAELAKEQPKELKTLPELVPTLIALMLHSALEGMALGVQQDKAGVILLMVAILSHQWGEDFAMAAATAKTAFPMWERVIISCILSVSCPIGIGIGWAVSEEMSLTAIGYIFAISTGSFINIACSSIVPAEMPHGKFVLPQIGAIIFGTFAMWGVMVGMYDEDAHDH